MTETIHGDVAARALQLAGAGAVARLPASVYSIVDGDVLQVVVLSDSLAPRCDCGRRDVCEHILSVVLAMTESED